MKLKLSIVAISASAMLAWAQPVPRERMQHFEIAVPPVFGESADFVKFVSSEMSWEGKLVKGAPYSADAVTESTQILPDGNRIVRKSTAQTFRDGEGRTRREQSLSQVGPWASGQAMKSVFINDPVAGVNYILEPNERTARKITLPKAMMGTGMIATAPGASARAVIRTADVEYSAGHVVHTEGAHIGIAQLHAASKKNATTTSLGKQMIEGVMAEGTRTTHLIPAGEIGNERPIETVSERWYSPELQTVVMSKRNDPRTGETVYKLTGVRRGEPGRNLFEVP
ncbi:MAG: hypothetical protein ACRD8O_17540, partial [Bryobacteraceae bacterium]